VVATAVPGALLPQFLLWVAAVHFVVVVDFVVVSAAASIMMFTKHLNGQFVTTGRRRV